MSGAAFSSKVNSTRQTLSYISVIQFYYGNMVTGEMCFRASVISLQLYFEHK